MAENKKYYDIEVDALFEKGCTTIDDCFYLKDLKQRKLFIDDEICQETIFDITRHILQFNKEDRDIPVEERQPILLYISSNGGNVDDAFELIDVIENSKTPIYTINLSYQYSMAFLIGIAGHKRFATKNAKFLMHDGSQFLYSSGAKVQDQMKFQEKVEKRIKNYVLSKSNITSKEYDSKYRIEWYLFADEAKANGFTDYIIGEDCDIDKII